MKKVLEVFVEVFEINGEVDVNELQFQNYDKWDSVAHMSLISALEEKFDIMLDTDDVIDLSSFQKACEILVKNGVQLVNE